MTLTSGSRLAHYEILSPLGAGGMGEVFRARDTKLGREVAIKVLPQDFVADAERMARFDREARVLASLNHPHIASIYGFEDADSVKFLVMELAEGETLADRLTKGALPVHEAIEIARQIAEALETAHEKGIIHRDLKPANVVVDENGNAKVLDFGLAKALDIDESSSSDITNSPTMVRAATNAGVILGTAAYMSPEQARGKKVDRRADIWSFGVVLFEMLTGTRLFLGETVSDTLAAVIKEDPEWDQIPDSVPPHVRQLLGRCLTKDTKSRLQAIGEARIVLEEGGATEAEALPSAVPAGARRSALLPWALFVLSLVVIGALLVLRPDGDDTVLKVSIVAPDGNDFHLSGADPGPAVVSPNGKMIAFSARDEEGTVLLWVRDLSKSGAQVLGGTEKAQYPFWSPDSKWIAFFTQTDLTLKKIAVDGGPPVTICPAADGKGGSWSSEGVIVFSPRSDKAIVRVAATGGEPTEVTTIDQKRHNSHRHPRFLPDGRHFLFLARSPSDQGVVCVGSVDGGESKEILESRTQAEFMNGHILYVQNHALLSAPFDPDKAEITGGAVPLVERVGTIDGAAIAVFSASRDVLAYQSMVGSVAVALQWLDEKGEVSVIGQPGEQDSFAVSPDGSQIALDAADPLAGTGDIWLLEVERGIRTRFTFDPAEDRHPVWTPDGQSVIFGSNRAGKSGIYKKLVNGTSEKVLLYESSEELVPTDVSPDGRFLLFTVMKQGLTGDLMLLPLDDDGEPRKISPEGQTAMYGAFSPDGRWISYVGFSADRPFIFAMPFPGPGRALQISPEQAFYPSWRDRTRVVYQELDGSLVSTEVTIDGGSLRIGATSTLLPAIELNLNGASFSQSFDGERFVIRPRATGEGERIVNLVMNWERELKEE